MPEHKLHCNVRSKVDSPEGGQPKPRGVVHLPPDHPLFEQAVACNLEGSRVRLKDILRRIEVMRESSLSPEGQIALRDALSQLAGGESQADLYTRIADESLSIQELGRHLERNAGSISRDWTAEKLRMRARAIAGILPLQQADNLTKERS